MRCCRGLLSISSLFVGLKKPNVLVQRPGPKVPIGDGRPVISPVGSQITELAFVKITLSCPADGSPRPKITWKKDGVELVPGKRYVVDDKGSLTITSAVTDDSGTFTCTAKNIAGAEEVSSSTNILGRISSWLEVVYGARLNVCSPYNFYELSTKILIISLFRCTLSLSFRRVQSEHRPH